jgi:hypothetical protein
VTGDVISDVVSWGSELVIGEHILKSANQFASPFVAIKLKTGQVQDDKVKCAASSVFCI